MPPVFGPVSPSPIRLKSCAGAERHAPAVRRRARRARPPRPRAAPRSRTSPPSAATATQRRVELARRAADEDALAGGEPVRLDDARRARDRQRLRRRHAGGRHHVLRERLRALDPRRRRRSARRRRRRSCRSSSRDAGDERGLRPDHDEVGVERPREAEQPVAVVGAHGMAAAERGDARGCRARRAAPSAPGSARAATRARARARPSRRAAPSRGRVYFAAFDGAGRPGHA